MLTWYITMDTVSAYFTLMLCFISSISYRVNRTRDVKLFDCLFHKYYRLNVAGRIRILGGEVVVPRREYFYFISFHFVYVIYAARFVRNCWARASVGQTRRMGHL